MLAILEGVILQSSMTSSSSPSPPKKGRAVNPRPPPKKAALPHPKSPSPFFALAKKPVSLALPAAGEYKNLPAAFAGNLLRKNPRPLPKPL